MDEVGEYIKEARVKKLGLGRKPFAYLMDVVYSTVKSYEEGKTRPKEWFIKKLEKLCKSDIVKEGKEAVKECLKRLALIEARVRSGWTQRDVGRMLGIDQTWVSKIENGAPVPKKWVQKLAQFYQTSKEILFPDIFGQKNTACEAA